VSAPDSFAAIRGTRIAHLIECDGPGGAERMLAELATEFARNGCPGVAFLPENGEGWLGRELAASGVAIEYFRLDRPFSPRFARNLAASFKRHDIGLAHSHEFSLGVYGAWAARKADVPHLITMHGGRYYAARPARRLALALAARSSGQIVAVSSELAAHLSRDLHMPRARVPVIMNGVRQRPLPSVTIRDELGLTVADRLLLAVGNLYPVKGHTHLLGAAARLRRQYPTLHVAIAGRGDNAAALEAQALALGLTDRVHLLGFRSDIAALLAGADIFVHPSLAEGLPLALLEAMFAARPIVASDVGEIAQVLGAGTGVVVPPADEVALSTAIGRLLGDPAGAREMGERAARRAADEYSLERSVARYADLYAQLLATALVSRSTSVRSA
jgi:glycosyltransferase involved in cell wall biosynthesis